MRGEVRGERRVHGAREGARVEDRVGPFFSKDGTDSTWFTGRRNTDKAQIVGGSNTDCNQTSPAER